MIANILRNIIPANLRPIRYLENLTRAGTGGAVRQGPFAGMRYIDRAAGSAFIPKLLGIYERELNECIEQACAMQFPLIVDIGAAEGYYAIGMARRNPGARVVAFEMEEKGRAALREMAALNGVEVMGTAAAPAAPVGASHTGFSDTRTNPAVGASAGTGEAPEVPINETSRLEVHGKCEFENLQTALASADRSLVICDVEGYEEVLLVPEKIPALARAHLLVEMHDFCVPNITERLMERFALTHDVRRIWQELRDERDFPFRTFGTNLLPRRYLEWAVSEWRPERMSWLWMEPKPRPEL